MKLKVKFLMMVAITSAVLLTVTAVGYFYARNQVTENITGEMESIASTHAKDLDGWMLTKAQTIVATGQIIQSVLGDSVVPVTFVQYYKSDPNLLDLYVGFEDGTVAKGSPGDLPAGYDPRKRGWYKLAKENNKLVFTDVYLDAFTNKNVVSAAMPVKGATGNFRGVIALDIALDIVSEKIKDVNLHGKGYGFIVDRQGMVLAHKDPAVVSTNINDIPALKNFAKDMLTKEKGMQTYEYNGAKKIMIYTKIPSTGWVLAITVDEKDAFAQLATLGYIFIIIALLGILISAAVSWRLSSKITGNVEELTRQAERLARGDISIQKINIDSSDEIGQLALAFSTMAENLSALIKDIAQTAEQVAASSEELTASAEQSADASGQVADSITEVALGAEKQLHAVEETSVAVDEMSVSIHNVVTNAAIVGATSEKTAIAAGEGNTAINTAMNQMNIIEKTVSSSAHVVVELGSRSKEIGQIVDTISGIAGQTNLLALNAAIEAARAGEQGRGFAVVAEEVRKLAEQSGQAAKQIAEMINEIQADTEKAVVAMQNGTREVNIGSEVVNKAGQSFKQIEILIEQVSAQVREITSSIQEMDLGSQKIVTAVQEINKITKVTAGETQNISAATEEQSASMGEIASASHALAKMAEELQKTIKKFTV